MTPLQDAFNQGVAAATVLIRFAASQYPKNYGLPPDALSAMADALDGLKHVDPEPPAPVDPGAGNPSPSAPGALSVAA